MTYGRIKFKNFSYKISLFDYNHCVMIKITKTHYILQRSNENCWRDNVRLVNLT